MSVFISKLTFETIRIDTIKYIYLFLIQTTGKHYEIDFSNHRFISINDFFAN